MRDIPEYEGLYAATSCGKIWSYRSKKFLKLKKRKDGYLQITLCKDGTRKTYRVHRLIAATYLDNPENLAFVNHIDENKTNNCVENLEYCTAKYNNNYGTRLEKIRKKVVCIETQEVFDSIKEAAIKNNVSKGNICNALKGVY